MRLSVALGIVAATAALSCKKPNPPLSEAAVEFQRIIDTQDRLNRYFHRDVEPRLTPCWATLTAEGTIAVLVPYERNGNRWVAGTPRMTPSTASGQDGVALRCLQEAVRNTSFAVEQGDAEAKEFQVNWSFPVPWPKDIEQVATRMISTGGGGGGGCGGPEAPAPACFDCGYIPILGWSYCKKVCAGYTNCTAEANGCRMGPITPKCVTASPFGNQGGIVRY